MPISKNILHTLLLGLLSYSCNNSTQNIKESNTPNKSEFSLSTLYINDKLEEISGLHVEGSHFYGFNDSGGEPELYKIDENGNIIQTVRLTNAMNIDWESIAVNDTHVFIGDIGNNKGNRTDLCIYYFNKNTLNTQKLEVNVNAKKIDFYYPEQTNFENQNRYHDFDCEALCWFNNQLHLFTKEWKSNQTHHYTLNPLEETQAAKLINSYNTEFLVTGADILENKNQPSILGLIGYQKTGNVYFIKSEINKTNLNLLDFEKEISNLGNTKNLGQVEGIGISTKNTFYISAEEYRNIPQNITFIKQAD